MDVGTIIIAVATVVTGIATCVSAFVAWDAWRGRLAVEWKWAWAGQFDDRRLEIEPVVANETGSSVQVLNITVDGFPIRKVTADRQNEPGTPANVATIYTDVMPHTRKGLRIIVQFDWRRAAALPAKRRLMRSNSDALLRIHLTLVSRSSRKPRRRFSTKIMVPRQMIESAIGK